MALQEHADKIIALVEMMTLVQKDLPCFVDGEDTIVQMKQRFFPFGKKMNEHEAGEFTMQLIKESYGNWRTYMYDQL
jgi:phosphatidylinositol kinase/protein kinase (PI-3  family)